MRTRSATRGTASSVRGGQRRLGEHPFDLVELPQLVQRLGAQQRQIGRAGGLFGQSSQSLHQGVIVGLAGHPGRSQQEHRIGTARRVDPRDGHAQLVAPAAGPCRLDPRRAVEQHPAPVQRRHRSPDHLAIERMGEPDGRPTAVQADVHQPGSVELVDGGRTDHRLQLTQTDRLPHGHQIERSPPRTAQMTKAVMDRFAQQRRARQVTA